MTDGHDLVPRDDVTDELRATRPVEGFDVRRLAKADPALSRRLYDRVGQPWQWTDRLGWGLARGRPPWPAGRQHLRRLPRRRQHVGYAELVREGDTVEIASFGLLPGFAGRGLGGALLAAVTQAAWDDGAGRVWLHTCSLDSPAALPSYERRGFRRYEERIGR